MLVFANMCKCDNCKRTKNGRFGNMPCKNKNTGETPKPPGKK